MRCKVDGCTVPVEKEGHTLCYSHWKAEKGGQIRQCSGCQRWLEMTAALCGDCAADAATEMAGGSGQLSSTKLGEKLNLTARRANLLLAELGWIEKNIKGWRVTDQGRKVGGSQKEARQTGIPYVVWPASVLQNKVLLSAVREASGEAEVTQPVVIGQAPAVVTVASKAAEFRARFPATHRTTDGHMVRSRAEMLIDNWLYMQQIAHAYERKLPIEEDVYCDFYLPAGKVYIEYWGMEKDPAYAARMQEKKAVYAKHGLSLIELSDPDIMSLDDALPRLLLKHNIPCD